MEATGHGWLVGGATRSVGGVSVTVFVILVLSFLLILKVVGGALSWPTEVVSIEHIELSGKVEVGGVKSRDSAF